MQKITTQKKALIQRLFLALFAMLIAGFARAGPVEDAISAYNRKDYAEVLRIAKPLAINGEAWAQTGLAILYNNGEGVVQDYAEAVKWYRLAAQQGEMNAQNNLGLMYNNGRGVGQDYAEAVKWYRLAAQQGDTQAQNNLGVMYANGTGVMQNYVKAHSWYNLSAVSGNALAIKNRDSMAQQMTPQQIAAAQKLARDCQARLLRGCD